MASFSSAPGVRRDAPHRPAPRVVVMGGSLGGLNAALWLRDAGCDVDVYERSRPPLEGRGAGIVLHPAVLRYFTRHGLADIGRLSAPARWARYLDRDARLAHEEPCRYRFTSWTTLYRAFLDCFDRTRYHTGEEIAGFEQRAGGVRVRPRDGRHVECDALVCADGILSTARRILLPDAGPRYAGYVGWRGTARRSALDPGVFAFLSEAITYFLLPNGHILAYPIPDPDESPVQSPAINWVWYRNVAAGSELDDLMTDRNGTHQSVSLPPGLVQERHVRGVREAGAAFLPRPLAEMVRKTDRPFVQAIVDVEVPRMAFGRVCLLGDAAFALRPHAAAGTAKAAEDAWQLGNAVSACGGDVVAALPRWETRQLALGRAVMARARDAGNRLQFEGSWRIGEPLPFGLYRTADSAEPDTDEQPSGDPVA